MSENDELNKLKKALQDELSKDEIDNDKIISLTNDITRLDKKNVRFSVDAGIINRLGKELVGRHETAVSELVKNAFDADAITVDLTFENAWEKGGTLTISDNGLGMTRSQLIDGFMRLSSSEKIHNPISERYKRIRAGKKGIGRFATQRLGDGLTIITQTLENDYAIKIHINWDKFETDLELTSISNTIEVIDKQKVEGTDLIITGLREGWSNSMINRVYRYTAELLQPFPLSDARKDADAKKTDPGFKSSYFRKDGSIITPIVDEEEAIYKHAVAEIEGYVLKDGQGCWSLKSDKLNFEQEVFLIGKARDEDTTKFLHIKNVHFKCYYFIWEKSLLPAQSLTFIRDIANERGGIRVYRNGFRVLPYGEKGNDWTGLDASVRKNVIITPHANNSFFGFVELTDIRGEDYEETSSREGLIENASFEELTDFVYRSIVSATIKVAELRGRKATASQKNYGSKDKSASEKVDDAFTKLKEVVTGRGGNDEQGETNEEHESGNQQKFVEYFKEFEEARQEEKREIEEEKTSLIDEINMLRILAGLGLVIGEFVHEVQRFLPGFDAEISYLKDLLKNDPVAMKRVELLEGNVKAFTAYTSYFDKAISRNVIRELESIELRDVVKDFRKVIENELIRAKIQFDNPEFLEYKLFTVPMHPSEWASILFNLYTNSKKAIIRSKNPGKMAIVCGKSDKIVFLEFSDNGDGIPKQNEDKIFNAFFTTTSAANYTSSEADSLVGTGLGLKIIKDIIEAYGGEIYVTTPADGFNTTFRIEVPRKQS